MYALLNGLLVLLILSNLVLLGSSRLGTCIRVVALQGGLLGLLPLAMLSGQEWARALLLAAFTVALKGCVFPALLLRTMRTANVRREVEPLVSYPLSLTFGIAALWLSFWIGGRIPLTHISTWAPKLILPTALFTVFTGFFMIAARRKALTQVLGYLTLENGIFVLGLVLVGSVHFLVELGVLLDVFVAVFVMSIAIYHLNREFDHINVDRLSELKG